MSYKGLRHSVGHATSHIIHKPGQLLYRWSQPGDLDLKPDTYERASVILDEYLIASQAPNIIENGFTPASSHPRYGLTDDYFWIKKGELWGLVKIPIKDGDYIFLEKKLRTQNEPEQL